VPAFLAKSRMSMSLLFIVVWSHAVTNCHDY
jgi:hypothetical protein